MDWRDIAVYALVGAAAGGLTTVAAWAVFSKVLDRQFDQASRDMLTRGEAQLQREIRQTLDREIPRRVGAEIDSALADAGITRETGERLSQALALADRAGLIGLRGGWR